MNVCAAVENEARRDVIIEVTSNVEALRGNEPRRTRIAWRELASFEEKIRHSIFKILPMYVENQLNINLP